MRGHTEESTDRAIALLDKALTIKGPNELLFATLGYAYALYGGPLGSSKDESALERSARALVHACIRRARMRTRF